MIHMKCLFMKPRPLDPEILPEVDHAGQDSRHVMKTLLHICIVQPGTYRYNRISWQACRLGSHGVNTHLGTLVEVILYSYSLCPGR